MAERVKRRLTAAKLSVSLGVAAIVAGFVAQDRSPTEVAYDLTGAQPHMIAGSITSKQVKLHSLLFKDFKPGQIYSEKAVDQSFLKIESADAKFLKIDDANAKFLKIDSASNDYLTKTDAANTYIKGEDAQKTFVAGDGSVFTGSTSVDPGKSSELLTVPGLATFEAADAAGGGTEVKVTNLTGAPLDYATPTESAAIPAGQSVDVPVGGVGGQSPSVTVQLLPAVQKVATFTFSTIRDGNTAKFVAQGLVGSP